MRAATQAVHFCRIYRNLLSLMRVARGENLTPRAVSRRSYNRREVGTTVIKRQGKHVIRVRWQAGVQPFMYVQVLHRNAGCSGCGRALSVSAWRTVPSQPTLCNMECVYNSAKLLAVY